LKSIWGYCALEADYDTILPCCWKNVSLQTRVNKQQHNLQNA